MTTEAKRSRGASSAGKVAVPSGAFTIVSGGRVLLDHRAAAGAVFPLFRQPRDAFCRKSQGNDRMSQRFRHDGRTVRDPYPRPGRQDRPHPDHAGRPSA
jgi:hypothetical protein